MKLGAASILSISASAETAGSGCWLLFLHDCQSLSDLSELRYFESTHEL